MKHVVIIGGGFGGLALAHALRRDPVRITLVDRRNHHLFQPLLYQVATAALAPSDIAEPVRAVLARQSNIEVRLGAVDDIDVANRRLRIGDDHVDYDVLVLAAGVTHSYFGNDAWAEHAPGLKTIGDALDIRRRMLTCFEKAEWIDDAEQRRKLTTFVVVGAGPTGVEMAGAMSEIACYTLRNDFRRFDTRDSTVVLVEAGPAVLGTYPDDLQQKAREALQSLGVQVRTNTRVTNVDADGVDLGDERLDAGLVVWAAGVAGNPLARALGAPLDRAGRVLVEPDLSIPGHPEVMVIGDLASFLHQSDMPKGLPGTAPVAQAMGKHAAANIRADLGGSQRTPFSFRDLGAMATIGRKKAVWTTPGGRIRLSGFIAWLAWVFVHLMVLVTFRNRAVVFVKWAWAWFTYDRASRLIWQGENAKLDS